MYDDLRAWFETFQSDEFTVAVVGALVDAAETLRLIESFYGKPWKHTNNPDWIEARDAVAAVAAALASDHPTESVNSTPRET
jgi:hypothetical protein